MATKVRFIRIPDALWNAVVDIAHRRNTNVSTVVRDLLTEYVARHRTAEGNQPAEDGQVVKQGLPTTYADESPPWYVDTQRRENGG